MSRDKVKPTNSDEEAAKGRIAFWLDPEDLQFLASQYSKLPKDASGEVVERWARISFRAHSALHKAKLK